MNNKKTFRRHFRIYFKNNHPAYIIDEEGNMYVFHRMTHSKTSGGRTNLSFDNPLLRGGDWKIYIVKKEQKDKKSKFSAFELELKPNVDISFPEIKKSEKHPTLEATILIVGLDTNPAHSLKQRRQRKARNNGWRIFIHLPNVWEQRF